ncbi:hypothetical protein E2Y33_23275 [Salmonella enterica]|nr:hypothetical protein [Salmonella enterica]
MADEPKKVYRGAGRAAFLAHVDTFRELLDAGHPMRAIYDDHAERLGIGYPQFTRHVSKFIRKEKDNGHQRKGGEQIAPASPSPASTGGAGGSTEGKPAPELKPGAKRPGFEHNPNSGNNRDDLI